MGRRWRSTLLGTAALTAVLTGGTGTAGPASAQAPPITGGTPVSTPVTTPASTPVNTTPPGAVPTVPPGCLAGVLGRARAIVMLGLGGRVQQLAALKGTVTRDRAMTAADRATLTTDLANESSGIAALQAKVPTDPTCADVLADGRSMVTDFRVYVVMTPQVRLTAVADTETFLVAQLQLVEPRMDAAITTAQQQGLNVTAAQQALADAQHQMTVAAQAAAGISVQVLAFTPASYPGCWSAFPADQQRLQAGSAALHQVGADLHIVAALRSPPAAATTTAAATP